jgi:hypothetical protein
MTKDELVIFDRAGLIRDEGEFGFREWTENWLFWRLITARYGLQLTAGALGVVGTVVSVWLLSRDRDGVLGNLAAEIIGIAATVLVIQALAEARQRRSRLSELLALLASGSRDLGLAAVAELTNNGGLYDGAVAGARLEEANLEGAKLDRADLENVHLTNAVLRKALLRAANLGGALLHGADFGGAVLEGASLRGATLAGANLRGAHCAGANFEDADLSGALVAGCDLAHTTGLIQAQIESAVGDGNTELPPGLVRPNGWLP